ncbi:hypothetical protein MBLNU459_g4825t1 [Dothideomycetes sp. NU459]
MSKTRVAVVGAAGETGASIINGLIEAGNFSIVALTRPASVSKPANVALKDRGVDVVPLDLGGPEEELVAALTGTDVVVSAIGPQEQPAQIPLATAAKKAGVKRFLPCGFITVAPPGGIMDLRDQKEVVYNHLKKIYLPYTIVDVGWWYQIAIPKLPSGKIDYFADSVPMTTLIADGNTPSALTDVLDIGRYIARIIVDPRTLNKYVLAYSEVWTPNDVYSLLEKLSGESIPRNYISEAQLRAQIESSDKLLKEDPTSFGSMLVKIVAQYQMSWGVRGDNTPEYATFLGYLTSKELYPDLGFRKFEDFVKDVLAGGAHAVYKDNDALRAAVKGAP